MRAPVNPPRMCGQPLDPELLALISRRLKVLGDPTRLQILTTLDAGELCVGEIVERVGSSQANISKHLGLLRGAGLVHARRDGANVCYSLADASVFELCRVVCRALQRQASAAVRELAASPLGGAPAGVAAAGEPAAPRSRTGALPGRTRRPTH